MADLRTVGGAINANGTTKEFYGGSFDIHKQNTGLYLIQFERGTFSSMPIVVVTQNYRDWNDFGYGGGITTDNAVLVAVDKDEALIVTGDGGGRHSDRNFCFIAFGVPGGIPDDPSESE